MAKKPQKASPVYVEPVAFEVVLKRPREDGILEPFRMSGNFAANADGAKKLLDAIAAERAKLAEHKEDAK